MEPIAPAMSLAGIAVLETLADVGQRLADGCKLESLLDRLLSIALRVAWSTSGAVLLLGPERDVLVAVAARGAQAQVGRRYRTGPGAAPLLAAGGDPSQGHPVVVPLVVEGRLLGILRMSRDHGATPVSPERARLLELLASQMALLVDHARRGDELRLRTGQTAPEQATAAEDRALPVLSLPLSAREREVLALLGEGLSNKEIAARLGIALGTVKVHLRSVSRKLGARDRTHLAVIALRAGVPR